MFSLLTVEGAIHCFRCSLTFGSEVATFGNSDHIGGELLRPYAQCAALHGHRT